MARMLADMLSDATEDKHESSCLVLHLGGMQSLQLSSCRFHLNLGLHACRLCSLSRLLCSRVFPA